MDIKVTSNSKEKKNNKCKPVSFFDNKKDKSLYIQPDITVDELTTALYHVTEQLNKANNALKLQEQLRMEMFSNISHDLRSPITTIRSSLEYILSVSTLDPEELSYLLKNIAQRIIVIEKMIDDIFLLTILDNETIPFQFTEVDLGMLLENFYYTCVEDNKYKNRNLILAVPETLRINVLIDAEKIIRVLDNLFTNSLKYSSDGSTITLDAYQESNQAVIKVSDTGQGIKKENMARIFDRCYTESKSRTPSPLIGCGLGLSITKSIIERHHGTIWCNSKLGCGSDFYFSLPMIS